MIFIRPTESCETDSLFFVAAIAIGFDFKQPVNQKSGGLSMAPHDRESLRKWIREHGPTQAEYGDAQIDKDGRGNFGIAWPAGADWIYGLHFRIARPEGGHFVFITQDESHIEKEMLIQRETKAIAKEAPDPETPPLTLKTRKDIM